MRVAFHTLGCKVNQYETEAIREQFVRAGHEIIGEDGSADVYIINTCTVTNLADRKSRQFIRKAKKNNRDAVIAVTGCYAQTNPGEVSRIDGVEIIIGTNEKNNILRKVEEYMMDRGRTVMVKDYAELTEYEELGVIEAMDSRSRAFVKIEDGCDRFCSYCVIPFARGKVRSRSEKDILTEVRSLLAKGYGEIVLTGINTALYGKERGGLEVLDLLKKIDEIRGDFRVRLSSLEPTVINAEYVKRLLDCKKLCHHLHLSVQSGSNKILREMNRRYNRDDYLRIVETLREFDGAYGITTDIIVGFPGETEEEFLDSVRIIEESRFSRVHAFKYSERRGTPAAARTDKVDGETKNERIRRLMETAEKEREAFNRRSIGTMSKVLAERNESGYVTGYSDNYTKVYIDEDDFGEREISGFYLVKLLKTYKDGMIGEVVRKP